LLVFGLLVYVIALIIHFPAQRAYAHWQASEHASRDFALAGISGSVWSGRADEAVIRGQRLQDLEWTLRPWALLSGQVGVDWRFQVNDGYGQGATRLGLDGSVRFASLEGKLPATQLASLARAAAVRPSGEVNFNLNDVYWDGQQLRSAQGRIVWNGAGINLFKPLTLGDLAVQLDTKDDAVQGVLSDGGGPLSAEGLLTLSANGAYQFSGRFAARNDKDLAQALRTMGRPGADGKVAVKQSGTLASLGLLPRR
jgi:general secretion pathway protein N